MQLESLSSLLPADFNDSSYAWVFQSNRPFIEKEEKEINEQLYQFYAQWMSHGQPIKGWAKVLYRQFIVVMAEQDPNNALCGSSRDAIMRLMKSLERQYSINLFDRMNLTFLVKDKAEMLPMNQVQYALDKGYLTPETPFFNNAITTKEELLSKWLVPVKDSWLAGRLQLKESSL